ncbi:hypothetical protein E2C01_031082 [Portunus trituberculatus]|uniref:Endonuclease/exonuclease/phosphatase domain-containing protein n=1 Tax=Portunus trituberculatus TaxID=210409 RepID=A0A5B7EVX3_PORTR|nr:hypothetical protein [Portunus trituberculatus]
MLQLIVSIAMMLTWQCPRYRLEQDILQLANAQFISLGSARRELLYRQKDGTGATSYASLATRSSAESSGPKTIPPATSRSIGGLTKRHRDSAESIDLAQHKQSKVSPGAHDREPSRDRSAMIAPVVSVQPDEDGLSMETSDDIVTAVPRGPAVSKSAVQPDPRLPMTGRSNDGSHHSPVGRKAAVQRPGTSQLPVSSCRLIISSQWNCRGLRASWGELRALLSEFSPACVALQETMLALQTIPRTSGRFIKRLVPWWNAACTNAVKAKREDFFRLRRHRGDPHCMEAFRGCRARARRVLKEAQRASWKAYVSSINASTPLTDVFNKVRRIAGKYSATPQPVLLSAGRTVADPKTVADLFAEHFLSVSRKNPAAPGARHRQRMESLGINFPSTGGESYNIPFSASELRTALSHCHDSSPGPDDIPYAFLHHMSDNILVRLSSPHCPPASERAWRWCKTEP